jgi:hypothetical protein
VKIAKLGIRSGLVLFSLLIISIGCKTKYKIQNQIELPPITPAEAVIAESPDSLLGAIKNADAPLKWFSAKVDARTSIDNQTNNFNANIRMRIDSAIWISISPALGIEVARAFITPDSLKFINRINGTFFTGNYAYLNNLLQIEVNFNMIQSILIGNSYLHYTVENFVSAKDEQGLILSTLRKRKIRRGSELELPQILTQEIWYSPSQSKIIRMEMQDYRPVRKFSVLYPTFTMEQDIKVPSQLIIQAQAEKQVFIDLSYSRITVNQNQNLPFSIPKNYEQIRK